MATRLWIAGDDEPFLVDVSAEEAARRLVDSRRAFAHGDADDEWTLLPLTAEMLGEHLLVRSSAVQAITS